MIILKDYATHKNQIIWKHFAYNLPGVLQVTEGKIFDKLKQNYQDLILKDDSTEIRLILISSIAEVVQIVNEKVNDNFGGIIRSLLKDKNKDILQKLLLNFHSLV